MTTLTTRDKDVCSYTGVFGILLSATCLIQNFIYFLPHWITTTLIIVYLLAIVAFSLLTAQHWLAPILLIITGTLLMICSALLILLLVFSLVVVLLFIYIAVITIMLYVEGFPVKLRQKAIAARNERDLWRDKI